jgi:ankyrin repeat protein
MNMRMQKKEDDNITKFLFAASRGDTATITFMCDHGFDPNSSDYDRCTALMVAAKKGNTDATKVLLDFQADPNAVDVHGITALFEAAVKGHEDTMEVLIHNGAKLCTKTSLSASMLCQSVFNGDIQAFRINNSKSGIILIPCR